MKEGREVWEWWAEGMAYSLVGGVRRRLTPPGLRGALDVSIFVSTVKEDLNDGVDNQGWD